MSRIPTAAPVRLQFGVRTDDDLLIAFSIGICFDNCFFIEIVVVNLVYT